MASEYVTFEDLVRFHKEVIAPDLDARMEARLTPMAHAIASLETRMEEGFDRLHDQIIDTRREMHEGFDDLYARFDELSTDFDASKGGLRRVEQRVDRHEARISRLEKKAR